MSPERYVVIYLTVDGSLGRPAGRSCLECIVLCVIVFDSMSAVGRMNDLKHVTDSSSK